MGAVCSLLAVEGDVGTSDIVEMMTETLEIVMEMIGLINRDDDEAIGHHASYC